MTMLKRFILILACAGWAMTAQAETLDLGKMTDEQRQLFRDEVRAYLLDNPEIIMEAVQLIETRQAEAQAQADVSLVTDNADALFNDGFSYVGGNPEGDITLVEFLDYRCGYCKRAHSEVAQLLETDGNIRLIVKEFPILGEQSVLASRFAIATRQIAGPDDYKSVSDALMTFNGDITPAALSRLADTFNLDMAAIETRMNSDEVTREIAETRALAQRMKISGTPTFVMQDEMLRGYLPYDSMKAILDGKRG
jgi:protein-disulfide isomerase